LAEAIREARICAETGEEKVIVTALCGHGHLDLPAYDAYLSGRMTDEETPDARFAPSLAELPTI
jgi:tryptophan synthase beta chain